MYGTSLQKVHFCPNKQDGVDNSGKVYLSYYVETAPMASHWDTRFLQYGVVQPQDANVKKLTEGEPLV